MKLDGHTLITPETEKIILGLVAQKIEKDVLKQVPNANPRRAKAFARLATRFAYKELKAEGFEFVPESPNASRT